MSGEKLQAAREYEARNMPLVSDSERPAFHVTGGIGWINDPNGFSCYRGEYHLFFQYHPYSTQWGPMHWGHVKTRDFVRWERLPVALAPDADCDRGGCFSGSAVELDDGRQMLMYTGVRRRRRADGEMEELQTQCVAFGDGADYVKHADNPVLDGADLPAGGSAQDFRDPKLWREADGTYCCAVANRAGDGSGAILLYVSGDGLRWDYAGTLDRSRGEYGGMWECPDFFPLGGQQVLLVSAQGLAGQGCGTLCLIGGYDCAARRFDRERAQSIDYGIDFYAPQTLLTPDGRRVMIAWMQNWASADCQPRNARIYGEMTLPRELELRGGRLIQNPVRELAKYYGNCVTYKNVRIDRETGMPGIRGRLLDMTVVVRPADAMYRWFQLNVAKGGEFVTTIRCESQRSVVRVDRSRCGMGSGVENVREFRVRPRNGAIKLRIVMDRHSLELFVNDGEQAATFLLYTPETADSISFAAEGAVLTDVEKHDLNI